MAVENWKLLIVPFAAWGIAMAWYAGYQSGYQEGHQTAWEMAHTRITVTEADNIRLLPTAPQSQQPFQN